MSKFIEFGKRTAPGDQPNDLIENERLAAQAVAVIQADFSRPTTDRMLAILKCMEGQINAQIKR